VSRVTLYRMLSKNGNPTLQSLIGVLRHLGLQLWLVDGDFIARRKRAPRPKDQLPALVLLPAKARSIFRKRI
jgi:hypothetical protein